MSIDIEIGAVFLVIAFVFLLIGYFMGRSLVKVPTPLKDKKAYAPELFDPGDFEEEIDPFEEAMREMEDESEPKKIQTVE